MNALRFLEIAGVPATLRLQALACIDLADERSHGLLWAKIKTRYLRAGRIARAMRWWHNRLIDARPDWADDDIAPMLNITGHGDNGPWVSTPEGDRPVQDFWLNADPTSDEYRQAVAACYWCPGHHPRSDQARKAWYRRNGGEYRAWRLGLPVDLSQGLRMWQGSAGRVQVTVHRCGGAWLVKASRRIVGPLHLVTRVGFEVDNVFSGDYAPQMWYPIPGHELRAPVTWSVLPQWGPPKPAKAGFFTPGGSADA